MHCKSESTNQRLTKFLEKSKTVKSANHLSVVHEKIFSFCENKMFSDICLIGSDEVEFHTHKCILSASSDYFMARFCNNFKQFSEKEIKIQEFSGKSLKPILEFMYNGSINLQMITLKDTLKVAVFFQIKTLLKECCSYMEEVLDSRNCLNITILSARFRFYELYEKAFKCLCVNFEAVHKREDFFKLNEGQLSQLLSRKDLRVSSEEVLFLSLIKWIEFDRPNREKSIYNLFSKIRYWLFNPKFIQQHRSTLSNQIESLQMVCSWLEYHISPESRELISKNDLEPRNKNKLVLISCYRKYIYDPEINIWTRERVKGLKGFFERVVELQNHVFIRRGPTLRCIDLHSRERPFTPALMKSRCKFGLAILNNELYVVGGRFPCSKNGWTNYVDRYNFSFRKWQSMSPMKSALSNPQVAVAAGNLYIVGDENSSMQCFNPNLNEWTYKSFIGFEISNFGFTVVNEKLYIVGGQYKNSSAMSKFIYSFDPFLDKWEKTDKMQCEVFNPKCTSWNNQLIVFGGYENTNAGHCYVHKYNIESKKWTVLASPELFNCLYSCDIFNM